MPTPRRAGGEVPRGARSRGVEARLAALRRARRADRRPVERSAEPCCGAPSWAGTDLGRSTGDDGCDLAGRGGSPTDRTRRRPPWTCTFDRRQDRAV